MSVIDYWGSYVYRSKEYDKIRSNYYYSITDDISIYTDGSAIGNNNVNKDTPAGYGYIVIRGQTGKNHDKGEVLAEVSARVITDPENAFWVGATHGSNNTGELSAFHAALKRDPDKREWIFCWQDYNLYRFAICWQYSRWKLEPK